MASSSITSTPNHHTGAGDADSAAGDEPYQVLEVQMLFHMLIIDVASRSILHETEPIWFGTALFNLPLYDQDDHPVFLQIYIAGLLSSLNIAAAASEAMAGRIASFILRFTGENRAANFHVTTTVDNVLLSTYATPWIGDGGDRAPAAERFGMERVEEDEGDEELGVCCICLDEMKCKECEVVRIQCGHVYHKPCVSTWLLESDSCPLCRRSLSLKEGCSR